MIAVFPQDQVSIASAELDQYLEDQVETITKGTAPWGIAPEHNKDWGFIDVERRLDASRLAADIDTAARSRLEKELCLGRSLIEAKEKLTRRGEFSGFRDKLLLSLAESRKAMRIFQRFGGWALEKLVIINSAVNLYTLCQSKFDEVVEQLSEAAIISKELVKNLIKKVRDATRVERKKKQQIDPVSGWRQDPSGGARHYQLPPMHDESAAMKLDRLAQKRGVMPIQVVVEAIALLGETKQPSIDEVRQQFQEELQSAVSEMRDKHIEMQRQLFERDRRIAELEATLLGKETYAVVVLEPDSESVEAVLNDESDSGSSQSVKQEHNFSSWPEFAEMVGCERKNLFTEVKDWSATERQALSTLLAEYLEKEQVDALDNVAWVPEKLLHSALSTLSFNVSKISGGDNLVDEPEIEHITGCRFVSLQHLGIRRREQWVFESLDGRTFCVFGRDEFEIDSF